MAMRSIPLVAGIAAVAVYVVGGGDLLAGLLYDGYSFVDQAISELSAFGSPVRAPMMTVILVHAAAGRRGPFRVFTLAALAVIVGFGAAASVAIQGIEQNDTPGAGLFERINAYAWFAWLVVLASMLMRRTAARTIRPAVTLGGGAASSWSCD
jgi:hypothetical protein